VSVLVCLSVPVFSNLPMSSIAQCPSQYRAHCPPIFKEPPSNPAAGGPPPRAPAKACGRFVAASARQQCRGVPDGTLRGYWVAARPPWARGHPGSGRGQRTGPPQPAAPGSDLQAAPAADGPGQRNNPD
jgi:hypothetical protein